MEHLLYWSSALSRSSLSRKIIEYIMAFKRFLKVEMNTVLLHKNIGSRYYSQDRVHDPSRLLLVESIKKACDQCSDQFSITADEYDKMIDQIYAGTYTLSPSRIYVVKKERRDEKLSEILPISDYHYFCYEGQPGDMIVVAPDPKDIVVIIALTELLFDLCIYQKYTEEERVKSKTDEYKHLNRYHSNLIDMGDGQIECIGQFGVSVDIDTKNLIFHHQFDTRFPSTSRAFPSLSQSAGEGSSRAPLTSEDLPLLSQLRRDFIEGVPTEDSDRIGIINSTSAVPGAAERDALAVEAKKGIEAILARVWPARRAWQPWLPPPSAPGDPPVPRASFASILAGTSSSSPAVTKAPLHGKALAKKTPRLPPASTAVAPKLPLKQATSTSLNPPKAQDKPPQTTWRQRSRNKEKKVVEFEHKEIA
ncbi:hypothetical protein L1987_88143 [Smallanthus sonchifolius]|nr:hypothetical protein L1987_88143 [Smallanthus sonchifolius]